VNSRFVERSLTKKTVSFWEKGFRIIIKRTGETLGGAHIYGKARQILGWGKRQFNCWGEKLLELFDLRDRDGIKRGATRPRKEGKSARRNTGKRGFGAQGENETSWQRRGRGKEEPHEKKERVQWKRVLVKTCLEDRSAQKEREANLRERKSLRSEGKKVLHESKRKRLH